MKSNYLNHSIKFNWIFYIFLAIFYNIGATNNLDKPEIDDAMMTVLAPGDVYIIHLQADDPDDFAFVTFVDLMSGTKIFFSDCGADGSGFANPCAEGAVEYTVPAAGKVAGDVIRFSQEPSSFLSYTDSRITGVLSLATAGDQVVVFQDADGVGGLAAGENPMFISITNNASTIFSGNKDDLNQTGLPLGLTESGMNRTAIGVGSGSGPQDEFDNTIYNGSYNFTSVSNAKNAITNPINWLGNNIPDGAYNNAVASLPNNVLAAPCPTTLMISSGEDTACLNTSSYVVNFSGSPTGGTYSGPGVTDLFTGASFLFNPSVAGVGVHTITYTAGGCSATDTIQVFALPVVTFTALADLPLTSGVQNNIGGGTPTGGVYSGPGVTNDGNGMTYDFDPNVAGVGTHTLTYTFTDTNGCTNAASDDVEVTSPITVTFTAPADLCENAGIQTGLGSGTPTGGVYSGPGVTDDGNGTTYSFNPATVGVGIHTITYTVMATPATDTVEVLAAPPITLTIPAAQDEFCLNDATELINFSGSPTGGSYSGPGVTDLFTGASFIFNPSVAGVGIHTVTYTITNGNGCTSSATDTIEVFALPVVTFTALADLPLTAGVQNNLGGGTPLGGVYSGPGVTDDGNGMTYDFDPNAAGLGTHTLTYTFTDTNGCTNAASDDVEVTSPIIVTFTAPADLCENAGVQTGLGSGTPTGGVYSGSGVTDDGNGTTYSFNPAVAGAGVQTLTYTFSAVPSNDNVEIFAAPIVTLIIPAGQDQFCQSDPTALINLAGSPTGGVYSGPGINDLGNGISFTFNPLVAGPGVHIISYTFTNPNGCTNTGTDTIEVIASPVANFTALADLCIDASVQTGLGGATPTGGTYSGPGVTDDANGMTYSFDPAAAGIGIHTITYDFTNINGCSASASDDIEVFDFPAVTFTAPPSPVCPGSVLTGQGGGTPTGGVYSGPGITDDGNGMTYTLDTNVSGAGTHTITYTFTDLNSCSNSASDDVTVEDTTPPVITCPSNITMNNDSGQCGALVTFAAIATDNCLGTTTITYSQDPGTLFAVGTTIVTATATDGAGNISSCTFNVTVNDTEPPVTTCPADIIVSNDAGVCGAVVTFTPTITDNCPGSTVSSSPASGSLFAVGTTMVTVTGTDASGNTSSCTFNVTVNDTEPPVTTCPADIIVSNDAGVCGAVVTFTPTVTDNCPGSTVSSSPASGSLFSVGTTLVTVTGTDASGNTSSCTFNVTVNDTEPPAAVCTNTTVQLDASGNGSITAGDVDGGSTDNCGIASLSVSPSSFTCSDVGPNTVTLTVTDVNGNVSTCTAMVTVEDNVPPVAVCQDITIQLDANGDASIVAADVDGGSTDACGIAGIAIDMDTFDCSNVGPNNVVLTVTDVNGNTSMCTAIVTVEDNIPPTIACPADIIAGTNSGECSATVFYVLPAVSDNCGIDVIVQNSGIPSGGVFPIGLTTNQFTVLDVNGNLATCSFTVTVVDVTAPIAVCQDIIIQLDALGNASIVAADVDGGSSDNCAIASLAIDIDIFTCADVGPNNVTLTVIDTAGLSSSCVAVVTVEDVTPAVGVCQDITVQLDALGMVTIDPSLLDGGSTDACGGVFTYSATPDMFDCSNIGDNDVTLTVTDSNGNTSTCMAVVTVEDMVAPTLSCMDITVELDANGMATIIPEDVIAAFDDVCGLGTTSVDIDTFDCDDLGTPVLVTVLVTDVSGNTATCTATVTVEDNLGPQFDSGTLPVDVMRAADVNGEYILEDFTTDVIVSDNCSIADFAIILDQDPTIGTVLTVGVYDITLSAEDDLGNVSDYVFELTVTEFLNISENSFDISSVRMYPNPATDLVMLSNPKNVPLRDVSIYDITGRLIKTLDASQVISEMRIDISELASATYMFIIDTDGGQVVHQIVKE